MSNTKTVNKLITFELDWKHSDPELWFSVLLEGSLTKAKKKKLFDLVKRNFDREELTYVKTGNLYVYNQTKHDLVCELLNGQKLEHDYESDFKDNDIAEEDKGSYLFPVDYTMKVIDLSHVTKI